MYFDRLENHPQFIGTIAEWFFTAWGHEAPGNSITKTENRIRQELADEGLPEFIIAIDGNRIAGVAMLKIREMDIYPEKEFWLGGVYVEASYRDKGLASELVAAIEEEARHRNIRILYLQTESLDGGLYALSGWTPLEQVDYHGNRVLVMQKLLSLAGE